MVIENPRLRASVFVRTTVTTRMGQLQADQQAVIGTGGLNVLVSKDGSEFGEFILCAWRREELVGICASFVAHSYGFAAPYQFAAAFAEALPTSKSVFGGRSVWRSVPTFHGLNSDAIPNFERTVDDRRE